MSVLVAFSVTPLGVGENVGKIVAEAVRVVRESGLPNRTDAMFTLVEGECMGACGDAPVMLVKNHRMCSFKNDQKIDALVEELKK